MAKSDEIRAQRASVISSAIALLNKEFETALDPKNPDDRSRIGEHLGEAYAACVESIGGEIRWADVMGGMFYDVYIAKKETMDGASAYDLVRPDLIPSQFSHEEAYLEHRDRIDQGKEICTRMKKCSSCGDTKLANKFKRGAVCNSCRSKQYRERKKGEENG